MSRAHRHYHPGHVWHITHRCHRQQYLLKFAKDRACWLHWLYQARKRYGLCVLNYVVTSNHIHLLVKDQGTNEIARSMQLVAGRTAQQFNARKSRKGAYWEDRYHASAVQTDAHLTRCLVYIDLNMVRAAAVNHPADWRHGGYCEIQRPPARFRKINIDVLAELLGFTDLDAMRASHRSWVATALREGQIEREACWTESIAVGDQIFLRAMQAKLGASNPGLHIYGDQSNSYLREESAAYQAHLPLEKRVVSPK